MAAERPRVCAVVLNLCDRPSLLSCLASLEICGYANLRTVVVRNGPFEEGLEAAARAVSPRLDRLIFTGFNLGFAAGNRHGIEAALAGGADHVFLLNDDAEIERGALDLLVDELSARPGAGMLGPRVLCRDGARIWFSGAVFDPASASFLFPGAGMDSAGYGHFEPGRTDFVTGCALLASRAFIGDVGLMDDRHFLYWEDADWGLRAVKAGYGPLVVPAARVRHKVSLSTGGDDSPLKLYHKTRGQLLFALRHAPAASPRLLAGFARDIAWLLLKCRARGRFARARALAAAVWDHMLRRYGPGPDWLWRGGGR